MPDSDLPLPPAQPSRDISAPSPRKKRRWLLWGCGGMLAFVLVIVATVAITLWWMQRPIKPVVLSAQEKQVIDSKLQKIGTPPSSFSEGAPSSARAGSSSASARGLDIVTNSRAYV